MADTEETPAQRQARIRREKREAKIKGAGQERLDKITQLSGRTPESIRSYDSPVATPPRSATPAALPPAPTSTETTDPEQLKQQEEFIRAMLRSQSAQNQPGQSEEPEDPMIKMLSSLLGGISDDPNAPTGGLPNINPDDIAKATGLPSFVTNMMMGKDTAPPTLAEVRDAQLWKILHALFAIVAGIYMLFTFDKLSHTFGENPPAPATVQNPFVIFVTFEVLLQGLKPFILSTRSKSGPSLWWQTAKEIGRDGAVMVFLMGVYHWWNDLA